jgi:Zn-dependent protease with chaperone function
MFVISATFGADVFAPGESILARLLETLTLTPRAAARPAPPAPPALPATPAKFEGYAEWRHDGALIVDGQRIVWSPSAKFKGDKKATDFASIPLGYEVSGSGSRLADGRIEAVQLEAKPNGTALFETDMKQSMTEVETTWINAGKAFESGSDGKTRDIGRLYTSGPDVARVRRVTTRLTPSYLNPGAFRTYVVENKDWNAFAAPNGMIVVYDSLLRATDDDELAIVLGHELVHATHEHSRREFKTGMWLQLLALGVIAGAEKVDSKKAREVLQLATLFTVMAWRNGYSRGAEDQADRVGLRYCYEAGFNVRKGPPLWNRFAEKYGNQNAVVNFFFGNHTRSLARAKNLDLEIALNYSNR